jgi:isopentenyl-diphosphate delta-isomerase
MNFECELRPAFEFLYRAEFANELIEHEYDHVFVGEFDGAFRPEASEVEGWKWTTPEELRRDVRERPEEYTYWLRAALETDGWARVEAAHVPASEHGATRDAK